MYDDPNSYDNLKQKMIEAHGIEETLRIEKMAKDFVESEKNKWNKRGLQNEKIENYNRNRNNG